MSKKCYPIDPVLKIGEGEYVPGGSSFIQFAEYADVPGLENADISIVFKNKKEMHDVKKIRDILKDAGFTLIIHK
jgi:hypothetical protein